MRRVEFQYEANKNILANNLKKLQTSMNNYALAASKNTLGLKEYDHISNDALTVVLSIEKFLLLDMMYRTEEPVLS